MFSSGNQQDIYLNERHIQAILVSLCDTKLQSLKVYQAYLQFTSRCSAIIALISIAICIFGVSISHIVVLLALLPTSALLVLETQHLRWCDLYEHQVRLLRGVLNSALTTIPINSISGWNDVVAELLVRDQPRLLWLQALRHRLRARYLWNYLILWGAWVVKLSIYPTRVASLSQFISRCAVGPIGGSMVLALQVGLAGTLILVSIVNLPIGVM